VIDLDDEEDTTDGRNATTDVVAPHPIAAAPLEQQERPAVLGADYAVFDSPGEVAEFDFDKLEETTTFRNFLDALYIPERLLSAFDLFPTARTRTGNRANDTSLGWDSAASDDNIKRWRKWVYVRRHKEDTRILSMTNAIALGFGFALCVMIGVGLQHLANSKNKRVEASQFQMTSARGSANDEAPVRYVPPPPEIVRDEDGQVVEIRASDPGAVLTGFCQSSSEGLCEPVELAWSDPPHAEKRFGIYRSFYDLRAIEIRRDPSTRKWVAGNGRNTIDDYLAHELRMSGRRLAIRAVDGR